LTVDIVVLTRDEPGSVLLIQRGHEPFTGDWALPGGFVEERERTRDAAARELNEETGLDSGELELAGVYDDPYRDPRGWTVSVAYLLLVPNQAAVHGGDDASSARWFSVDDLPPLAFDHATIVADALARLSFCGRTDDSDG
jgi:8-oxo-dGTP diphosphatase